MQARRRAMQDAEEVDEKASPRVSVVAGEREDMEWRKRKGIYW